MPIPELKSFLGFGQIILNFLPRCCHTGVYLKGNKKSWLLALDFDYWEKQGLF